MSARVAGRVDRASFPRVLAVGPLPPPLSGASVSFEVFCDEMGSCVEIAGIDIVDSSSKRLKEGRHFLAIASFAQAGRILVPFFRKIRSADHVFVFGSNGFLLSMAPILLGIAKSFGRHCWIRSFGGSLDKFHRSLALPFRRLLHSTLSRADGLIVETKSLQEYFRPLIGRKVHHVPGYRRMLPDSGASFPPKTADTEPLRLAFIGHVREEKGIFVLLESLRRLGANGLAPHCDIFGPVYESTAALFREVTEATPQASYRGILSSEEVVPTLRRYDALVLPTAYQGEGHPGVILEAMMAGTPVITTNLGPITELVEDHINGLLVSPRDPEGLTRAIETIHNDRELLVGMGRRNWETRLRYDASRVVPMLLHPMGLRCGELDNVGAEPGSRVSERKDSEQKNNLTATPA